MLPALLQNHHLLLWDMGTGKTAALIAAGEQAGGRQLWITPGMLIAQAAREFALWRPGAEVQTIRKGKDRVSSAADVVIVSYDLMRNPAIWRQLYRLSWESCVCDEGHALAHTNAVRTRAFYGARLTSPGALFRSCKRVWVATGTPVMNTPDELWPHLSRLFPHLLGDIRTQDDFLDTFCVQRKTAWGWQVTGGKNLSELYVILAHCSSRLELADVTDIPPVTVSTVPVEISARDRAAMTKNMPPEALAEIEIILAQIEDGDRAAWMRLQAMLLPLASMRRVTALAKAPAAVDLIAADLRGGADRVVVFGSHVDALAYVAQHLAEYDARLLIGATTNAERARALEAFERGACRVLAVNTTIGGFGLNLQHAARAVMLDLPWTPAALSQAIARLARAGQKRPVHVSLLAVDRSIDMRVADILRRKADLIETILEGTEP